MSPKNLLTGLEMLLNDEIMIERDHRNDADSARRIKMIYNWAQRNGYNEIWTPKKMTV